MATLKTQEHDASVAAYLKTVTPDQRREDCLVLRETMERLTGCPAKMWGASIVGFGRYHYKYKSGREGDWFLTGFAPRKQALTVYIMSGFSAYSDLMGRLGKYKTAKSCLYLKKLADVDRPVLEELIRESVHTLRQTYGT